MSGQVAMVVFGAGRAGVRHARAAARVPEIRLAGFYDADRARAESAAAEFGVAAFDDVDRALAHDGNTVASICTPTGTHGELALRAARAGVHVIVEKPFDVDPAMIEHVESEAEKCGVLTGAIAQHRFSDDVRMLQRTLQRDSVRSVAVRVQRHRTREFFERSSGDWRLDRRLAGGGVLITIGFHYLDLACWLFGEPRDAEAVVSARWNEIDLDIHGTFHFGAIPARVDARWGDHAEMPDTLEIARDADTLVLADDHLQDGGPAKKLDKSELHARQLADFAHAVRTGGTPFVRPRDVAPAHRLIASLYESATVAPA